MEWINPRVGRRATLTAAMLAPVAARAQAPAAAPTDQDISDAYLYLLARLLVLRQEILDFRDEGFRWNEIQYREPGGVAWANPNLDVAYSEAWVGVDETTPAILTLPEIAGGRYYTWQMLNGWGETVLNINERTFPQRPFGTYALCLKDTNPTIPAGALRVDLPSRKSRVLARVELGSDPREAIRLQRLVTLRSAGTPRIAPPVPIALFANDALPKAEAFDRASEILASEADINPGMAPLQAKLRAVEALVKSGAAGRARVDQVIQAQALPHLQLSLARLGAVRNGWARPNTIGRYGEDWLSRTMVNLIGIWANDTNEVVYFKTDSDGGGTKLDGANTYTLTFPADALPISKVGYFWSVIAVDSVRFNVIPNPLNRFLLNKQSGVRTNPDGSLTLFFAPEKPAVAAEPNWLPTPRGQNYNLTFRFYGPRPDVVDGRYYPPPLMHVR
jgi:hypothetical protein